MFVLESVWMSQTSNCKRTSDLLVRSKTRTHQELR